MPESEETRELGGLARSIDALFSAGPRAVREPEAHPSSPEAHEPVVAASALDEVFGETEAEPDPFEALESVESAIVAGPGAEEPGIDALGLSDVDVPEEVDLGFESLSEVAEPFAAEPSPDVGIDLVEETLGRTGQEGPAEIPVETGLAAASALAHVVRDDEAPELSGSALGEAVDAFLAGRPGSSEEVESVAASLRERLVLDPLADAVEKLVLAGEGASDDSALQMAGKVINPAVASRLVRRMALEEDEERRREYLFMAERLGAVMANAFKGALTDASDARTREACRDGLMALGEEARPLVEAMIEDENGFLAQNGVAILGAMGGPRSVELVTSALANPDFRVRREALSSLSKLGGEDSGQLIMASLEDADATVRAAAAEAAGKLRLERALRPILALLEDESLTDDEKVPVQVQALRGLGYLGDPGAVQAIEPRAVGSLFSRPPTEVRVAAYRALHDIGTPHAREVIEKAKDDKDPVVRTTVRGFDAD